jgi:hypothetical protein
MKIRVLENVLMGGVWIDPGVGDFDPTTAQHLIDIGSAEPYETKVIEDIKTKKPDPGSSASQAGRVSRKKTARPSLTKEDCEKAKGKAKVIAVNDNYRLAPWADYLYACDARWWNHHSPVDFKGEKWTQCPVEENGLHKEQTELAKRWGLTLVPGRHGKGLGSPHIHYGANSGYQAINLAYLLGAGQIVLLGYDMQCTGGKQHWFGDHPEGPMKTASNYSGFVSNFTRLAEDLAAKGVDVVNCTRETALRCFRQAPLDDVL